MNDLKEAVNRNAAKTEAVANKAEEMKKKSDDRLFNLLETILVSKNKEMEDNKKNDCIESEDMIEESQIQNKSIVTNSAVESTPKIEIISTNLTGLKLKLDRS